MEKNKKLIISGVLVVFVILLIGIIFVVEIKLSSSNSLVNNVYQNVVNEDDGDNSFRYKISYFDGYEPGSKYDIYVYDNYDIIVDATHFSSIPGVDNKNVITKLVFKDYEKEELISYFDNLFENDDDNYIRLGIITDDDLNNINKIVNYKKKSLIDLEKYDFSKKFDYKLSYNLVYNYDIYKLEDIVKVKKIDSKDNKVDEYIVNFSEVSMNKIDSMFIQLFMNTGLKELEVSDVNDEQRKILDAIINNEEIFMDYVFKITDISCNCIPNTAYFDYDSYVVRNAIITGEDDVISRGKFNYDINKILNNLDEFKENEDYMNYKITLYNDEEYIVSHSDLRMIGLLKGLDIKWH